jgi:hypothetical protein
MSFRGEEAPAVPHHFLIGREQGEEPVGGLPEKAKGNADILTPPIYVRVPFSR